MVKFDKSTAQRGEKYVEDARQVGRSSGGGRRIGTPIAAGGGLIGIIIAVIAALTGLGGGGTSFDIGGAGFDNTNAGAVGQSGSTVVIDPAADPQAESRALIPALMVDIQDTWAEYFDKAGLNYEYTTVKLFTGSVQTGCGNATSAVGPFYCPAPNDHKVYIDLDFYDDLATRFGAPGDFAQSYVIAHEIGHHIQNLVGISDKVNQAQRSDPGNANEYSVRQELQADCFAGVWAYSAQNRVNTDSGDPIIEPGDIDEGLAAAASVGDDRIQAQAGMQVNPESWTHGSAEQRVRWFKAGYNTGDPEQCDTFAASDL